MNDGNLKLTASADFNRLENEVESLRRKTAKLEDQLGKVGQAARRTESVHESAFNAIGKRVQATIATYFGLSKAIDVVLDGMHEEIDLNRRAVFSTQSVADAKRQVIVQTGQFTDEQRERFFNEAVRIGEKSGIRESESIAALGEPLSATFGETEQRIAQSLEVFTQFAPLFVGRMEDAGPIMAAVLDAQRTLGGSAKEVTNFLLAALSQTRLTGVEQLPNLIRTLAASQAITRAPDRVQAAREVTALFGAFQALTGEAEGAITSTAITNFLAVMSEQAEERDLQPAELLKLVKSDEDLALQVAEKVLGKSFTKPVQREFLEEGNLIKAYEKQLKEFEAVDPKDLDSIKAFLEKDKDVVLDTALRKQQAKAERLLTDRNQQEAIIREMLFGEQGAVATGGKGVVNRIGSFFQKSAYDFATGVLGAEPFQVADTAIQEKILSVYNPAGGGIPTEYRRDPLKIQTKDPEILRLQDELRSLRELRDQIRSSQPDTDKTVKLLEKIEKNTSNAAKGVTTSPVKISPGKHQEN